MHQNLSCQQFFSIILLIFACEIHSTEYLMHNFILSLIPVYIVTTNWNVILFEPASVCQASFRQLHSNKAATERPRNKVRTPKEVRSHHLHSHCSSDLCFFILSWSPRSWSGEELDFEFDDSATSNKRSRELTPIMNEDTSQSTEEILAIKYHWQFKLSRYLKGFLCYSNSIYMTRDG